MPLPWNSLALPVRFEFARHGIEELGAKHVLDIGCGNGRHLTRPLAEALPEVTFLGVDEHDPTIASAVREAAGLVNLKYATTVPEDVCFDLIIASEVLEHVEDPGAFLVNLNSRLNPSGHLLLTVPNGYGTFELLGIIENILEITGVFPVLRRIKNRGQDGRNQATGEYSLAVSPHVNFFTMASLRRLLSAAGFRVRRAHGRMFLFDFITMRILDRAPGLSRLNARLGQQLPFPLVSDWMLLAERGDAPATPPSWPRNAYTRFKVWLNRKRWKLDNQPN